MGVKCGLESCFHCLLAMGPDVNSPISLSNSCIIYKIEKTIAPTSQSDGEDYVLYNI